MLLNDAQIRDLSDSELSKPMISPFTELCSKDVLSYGLSSFGYDGTLSTEFKQFRKVKRNGEWVVVNPKCAFGEDDYENVIHEGEFILPPHEFILGRTVEHFNIPEDTLAICVGKSTYARCGISVLVTPLEPGWSGTVTLEIYNCSNQPVMLFANEGICQFLFLKGERPETTYADRKGKYQNQVGVTLPTVLKSL